MSGMAVAGFFPHTFDGIAVFPRADTSRVMNNGKRRMTAPRCPDRIWHFVKVLQVKGRPRRGSTVMPHG